MHLPTNNLPSTSYSNYIEWTPEENKNFEKCLTLDYLYKMDGNSRFQQISNLLGQSKTAQEVKLQYDRLVYDLERIDGGQVDYFPRHWYEEENSSRIIPTPPNKKMKNSSKVAQWSDDEHRLFIIGVEIYGQGDWRSISRSVVLTRSSTQVASHAQKFFNKKKCPKVTKRSSIHNITTVNVDEANDLYRKGKLLPEMLDAYLQKLAFGPDQQEAHTSEPLETLASGRVQQEAYVPEPLNTLASGRVQQEAYVPEPLNTLASGRVQQEAYVPEPLTTLASGRVQQEAYAPEPLTALASGRVQQEAYVPEPLTTLASGRVQQEAYAPEPLTALASGRVQQEAYVPEPLTTLASGRVQQEAYVPEPLTTLASGRVQQEAYVPEPLTTLASGRVQQEAYAPEPLTTLASGRVQQEAYVPEPLTTLASGCVHQQETHTPESPEVYESLEMLVKEPSLDPLEVLASSWVQQEAYTSAPRAAEP